jgi:SAM-dependent methyltransferase
VSAVPFAAASKARLTAHDLGRFSGRTLFDRIARAVCGAGCLPRKELYEAWEVARRTRRLFRGGRVVDLAGGHGLLAAIMLLLDDSSPRAIVVDPALPKSATTLRRALVEAWPRLANRVEYVAGPIASVPIESTDVVVSSHACGALTDEVIARASRACARLAVLPCCHDFETCDAGPLGGWVDGALAIDVIRAVRLEQRGYRVWTQTIPADVTPKNRLLLGAPVVRS